MKAKYRRQLIVAGIVLVGAALIPPEAISGPPNGRPARSRHDCFPGEKFIHVSNYAGLAGLSKTAAVAQLDRAGWTGRGAALGWCVPDDGVWDYRPSPCTAGDRRFIRFLGGLALGLGVIPGGQGPGFMVGLVAYSADINCDNRGK